MVTHQVTHVHDEPITADNAAVYRVVLSKPLGWMGDKKIQDVWVDDGKLWIGIDDS